MVNLLNKGKSYNISENKYAGKKVNKFKLLKSFNWIIYNLDISPLKIQNTLAIFNEN